MRLPETTLSSRQAVTIAGRILCVFFLFQAACNLTNLVGSAHSAWHYMNASRQLNGDDYFLRYYLIQFGGELLRLVMELMLAGWSYRCGNGMSRFLTETADATAKTDAIS
jgi:hypothetical protein